MTLKLTLTNSGYANQPPSLPPPNREKSLPRPPESTTSSSRRPDFLPSISLRRLAPSTILRKTHADHHEPEPDTNQDRRSPASGPPARNTAEQDWAYEDANDNVGWWSKAKNRVSSTLTGRNSAPVAHNADGPPPQGQANGQQANFAHYGPSAYRNNGAYGPEYVDFLDTIGKVQCCEYNLSRGN